MIKLGTISILIRLEKSMTSPPFKQERLFMTKIHLVFNFFRIKAWPCCIKEKQSIEFSTGLIFLLA